MSTALSISDLPDVPLRLIFNRLPLADLCQVGYVCRRWRTVQQNAFKDIFHLQIKENFDLGQVTPDDSCFSLLKACTFFDINTEEMAVVEFRDHRKRLRSDFRHPGVDITLAYDVCNNFINNFSNIKRLSICFASFHRPCTAKFIVKLIKTWSSTLEEVVLMGQMKHYNSRWPRVEKALKKCTHLKKLTTSEPILADFKWANNSSLAEYNSTFNGYGDYPNMISEGAVGEQLSLNIAPLRRLCLYQRYKFVPDHLERLNPCIAWQLDRLQMFLGNEHYLEVLVGKCPNLIHLEVGFNSHQVLHIEKVFTALSQLSKLKTLKLEAESKWSEAGQKISNWDDELSEDATEKVPQLISVRKLTLKFLVQPVFVPFLVNLFPNIEQPIQTTEMAENGINLIQLS